MTKCPHCGNDFGDEETLKTHIAEVHPDKDQAPEREHKWWR